MHELSRNCRCKERTIFLPHVPEQDASRSRGSRKPCLVYLWGMWGHLRHAGETFPLQMPLVQFHHSKNKI